MKTAKLTVTIPNNLYEKIEKEKTRRRLHRSALVSQMIDFFFQKADESEKVNRYVAGYRKKPEAIEELTALGKVQTTVMGEF